MDKIKCCGAGNSAIVAAITAFRARNAANALAKSRLSSPSFSFAESEAIDYFNSRFSQFGLSRKVVLRLFVVLPRSRAYLSLPFLSSKERELCFLLCSVKAYKNCRNSAVLGRICRILSDINLKGTNNISKRTKSVGVTRNASPAQREKQETAFSACRSVLFPSKAAKYARRYAKYAATAEDFFSSAAKIVLTEDEKALYRAWISAV